MEYFSVEFKTKMDLSIKKMPRYVIVLDATYLNLTGSKEKPNSSFKIFARVPAKAREDAEKYIKTYFKDAEIIRD